MNFETARQEFSRIAGVHTTTEEFAEMLADSRVSCMLDGSQVAAAAASWKAWLERSKLYAGARQWSGTASSIESHPPCGPMTIPDMDCVGITQESQPESGTRLMVGSWSLDVILRRLWFGTKGPLELTDCEFRLLHYLMGRPGRAVLREELLRSVCNVQSSSTNRIDAMVCPLRKKLSETLGHNPIISQRAQNSNGGGYLFAAPEQL